MGCKLLRHMSTPELHGGIGFVNRNKPTDDLILHLELCAFPTMGLGDSNQRRSRSSTGSALPKYIFCRLDTPFLSMSREGLLDRARLLLVSYKWIRV